MRPLPGCAGLGKDGASFKDRHGCGTRCVRFILGGTNGGLGNSHGGFLVLNDLAGLVANLLSFIQNLLRGTELPGQFIDLPIQSVYFTREVAFPLPEMVQPLLGLVEFISGLPLALIVVVVLGGNHRPGNMGKAKHPAEHTSHDGAHIENPRRVYCPNAASDELFR